MAAGLCLMLPSCHPERSAAESKDPRPNSERSEVAQRGSSTPLWFPRRIPWFASQRKRILRLRCAPLRMTGRRLFKIKTKMNRLFACLFALPCRFRCGWTVVPAKSHSPREGVCPPGDWFLLVKPLFLGQHREPSKTAEKVSCVLSWTALSVESPYIWPNKTVSATRG